MELKSATIGSSGTLSLSSDQFMIVEIKQAVTIPVVVRPLPI